MDSIFNIGEVVVYPLALLETTLWCTQMPLQRDQPKNSEATRVVCMCAQLNRCHVFLCCRSDQMVCVFASTLCRYELRNGDLFRVGTECVSSVVF